MKEKIKNFLLWSQQYTRVDMLYIARGGFWSTLSFGITSALSLVILVALANLIPRETYGMYKYIISLAGSISFLTLTGMNMAVKQAVASGHEEVFPYAVKKQLKWNFLFLLGASAMGSYYLFKNNSILGLSLLILGIFYPLQATFNTYGMFLSGKKEFKKNAFYVILAGLFYFLSMLTTLFLTKNILIIITVYGVANFIPPFFFYSWIMKSVKFEKSTPKQEKELFRYSGHLSIVNIFSVVSQHLDKILVFQFLGPVQLAIYSIASVMPERINGFIKNFSTIMFPKLSEKKLEDIKPVFHKRVIQGLIIGGVMSILYIISAPLIFKVFLPQYIDSIFYSQLLSLSFVLLVPANYMGNAFHAQKMIKTIYKSSISANILRIILFLTLGVYRGILGMIAAALLMYITGFFYNLYLWQSEIKRQSV